MDDESVSGFEEPRSFTQLRDQDAEKTKPQGLLQRFSEQFGHVFWPEIR